jgi:dCMP deaminase
VSLDEIGPSANGGRVSSRGLASLAATTPEPPVATLGAVTDHPPTASPDARRSAVRPSREQYFMLLAVATRERANCLRRHVGAVLVADQRIIATGYNGTPTGFPNCDEGGCHRCAHPDDYAAGRGYDVCICVHAEQNAVLQAAKLGYSVQGSACYSTLRPCFGCLKELYQAGVTSIRYLNAWTPSDPVEAGAYDALLEELAGRGVVVAALELPDGLLDLR